MNKHRTFNPETKARVVLQVLTGAKSAAQVCREHNIKEQVLARWKKDFLEHASLVFQKEREDNSHQGHIAELERMVGKLSMELEISKKASELLALGSTRKRK